MIYGLAVVMLIETPQHNVKVAKRHIQKKALYPEALELTLVVAESLNHTYSSGTATSLHTPVTAGCVLIQRAD